MVHGVIQGKGGAGEVGFARFTNDAVGTDLGLNSAERVATGRGAGGGHAVGGEENAIAWFGAHEVSEHGRREVEAVGNEDGGQFVAGEEALDDVLVAREECGNGVAEVGAEREAGGDGAVDLGVGGIGMSDCDADAAGDEVGDDLGCAGPFRGKCDETEIATGGGDQPVGVGDRGREHERGIVGAVVARFGAKPGAFEVVAGDGIVGEGRPATEGFDVFQPTAEDVDAVGDEGVENATRAVRVERDEGVVKCDGRDVVLLKVDAGKTIDLKVEEIGGGR